MEAGAELGFSEAPQRWAPQMPAREFCFYLSERET